MKLEGLNAYPQFIPYKLVQVSPTKTKKIPCQANGEQARPFDPRNWFTFEECQKVVKSLGQPYFVGFALLETDPFFYIDIDNCLLSDKTWSPEALAICKRFAGAAVEVSSSGTGLHILGRGSPTPHSCKFKSDKLEIELYTANRPLALTYSNVIGDVDTDHTPALHALINEFFKPKISVEEGWTTEAREGYTGSLDDQVLLSKALAQKSTESMFNGKASFADLWHCNTIILAQSYPSSTDEYDRSSADLALATHLAFWTGCNCERIERLMYLSALVRDKWDTDVHASYLRNTIIRACSQQTRIYDFKPAPPVAISTDNPDGLVPNRLARVMPSRVLTPDLQKQLFEGCVYVRNNNAILTHDGDLLDRERFNATYGGYSFQIDPYGEAKPVKNAWQAFTESQCVAFPQAHQTCFRPDLPTGQIILDFGRLCVNTYSPPPIRRVQGDPSPFLNHLAKLIPTAHDRNILINYMATVVQRQGVKLRWCPLIQGTPGNGKSMLSNCVLHAVGERYAQMPDADQLIAQFNNFLAGHVFLGVQDIHVPPGMDADKYMNKLKGMITDDYANIRRMRTDPELKRNVANLMMFSNFKDALPKDKNDRRLCIIYTAQQSAADVWRDGMDDKYFTELHGWLNADGYAIVADFLWSYPLEPISNRAPLTSSTLEAIACSRSPLEQEILESIEMGRAGFKGNWVNSHALDELIEHAKLNRVPHNRRRELMQRLGYDWHPCLGEGRAPVAISNGLRPKLYCKLNSAEWDISTPAEVVKSYQNSQG